MDIQLVADGRVSRAVTSEGKVTLCTEGPLADTCTIRLVFRDGVPTALGVESPESGQALYFAGPEKIAAVRQAILDMLDASGSGVA